MDEWKKNSLMLELEKEKANEIPLNSKGEETDGYISEARITRGRRIPIVGEETDEQNIDYFVETFEMYWERGDSAKEIFKEVQFDEWGLKLYQVYYVAKKLGLGKRHKHQQNVDNS